METGQCRCRSHVVGRQCGQVEPGFYRINLDHYTYEAEDARLHQVRGKAVPGGGCRLSRAPGGTFAGSPGWQTVLGPVAVSGSSRAVSQEDFWGPVSQCPLPQGSVVEREPPAGRPASWTGTGFARVQEGSWLEFHVSDVPFSMEYDVIIRYEPQVSPNWCMPKRAAVGLSVQRFLSRSLPAAPGALEGGAGEGAAPQPRLRQQPVREHHPG